jgi:hypothetical protein
MSTPLDKMSTPLDKMSQDKNGGASLFSRGFFREGVFFFIFPRRAGGLFFAGGRAG